MEILYLILAVVLVFLNGFFVATEFAIVKVRPTRIEELVAQGHPGAKGVRRVIANIDGYLAATQFGITLASLGLGWLGEPAFASLLEGPLTRMGIGDPVVIHRTASAMAFGTITFLHIVVGELAPKSLAILRSEGVAIAVALPMRVFYGLFYPFIFALNGVANFLLKLFGLRGTDIGHGGTHSEEEIRLILGQARSAGLLSQDREELLNRALRLPTKTAKHLMVPRNEVVFLNLGLPFADNLERAMNCKHKRFPLVQRDLDEILGLIDITEVLYTLRNSGEAELDLLNIAQPSTYLPEMMGGERLLTEFRTRSIPMAVIVDEYGGTSGIITPADVVTAVMGELDEEDDSELVLLPGGAYDVEGTAPLDEVEEVLKTTLSADDMRTVAGFLMERLGRMPRVGDRVSDGGFSFSVLDVSGPRVKRVRIQREGTLKGRPSPRGDSEAKGT